MVADAEFRAAEAVRRATAAERHADDSVGRAAEAERLWEEAKRKAEEAICRAVAAERRADDLAGRVAAKAMLLEEAERRAEWAERQQVMAHQISCRAGLRLWPVPEFLRPFLSQRIEGVPTHAAEPRRINIGVLGPPRVGKTSLITAIFTYFHSDPSPIVADGARAPAPYELRGFAGPVTFWELPDAGAEGFPAGTYLRDVGLRHFDVVLMLTDGHWRLTDASLQPAGAASRDAHWRLSDASLHQALAFADIPCHVVRTKVDVSMDSPQVDQNLCERDRLEIIEECLRERAPLASDMHFVVLDHSCQRSFGKIDGLCKRLRAQIEERLAAPGP